jgi:hypothetical protein
MRAIGWVVWLSFAAQAVNAAGQGFPGTISVEAGKTVTLAAGANLQAALDSAVPGDTIELPAGATFTGNFVLPQKNGTARFEPRLRMISRRPTSGSVPLTAEGWRGSSQPTASRH